MSISDAQYLAWLADDGQRRIVLAEVGCYSGGAAVTRYLASGPFVSTPADTPANTAYDDLIDSIPSIRHQMSEAFSGETSVTWGDIDIINAGGELDGWLDDAWDGRPVKLYVGDPSWPKSDFRLILDGTIARLNAPRSDRLALAIRDKQHLLNVPIQTSLIGGTTANANQPIPLCFGECFNVEPLLIDAGTAAYQVHDGAINDITAVRDNGIALAYPAGYTKDLTNGKFALAAAPAGRITCDVQGAKPGGTYLTKVADIINHLATTRTTLVAGDIDATNFTAFNVTCPQTVGLYLRERSNLLDAVDRLSTSVGGWYGFGRAGLLQLGRLEAPSGTPALSLVADDIRFRALRITRRELPRSAVRLGYATNWTPQPDGLAGAVTQADRALYAAEQQVASAIDASIKTAHPLAAEPDLVPTLLVVAADADTEADRRLALYAVERTTYEAECFAAPGQIEIGQVVSLDHPRFGFDGGALARVVSIDEAPTRGRVTLGLWK